MTNNETFGDWLANQTHQHGPVGDLARDYVESCGCCQGSCSPHKPQTVYDVRRDLEDHGAQREAYDALDRAETEWRP